MRVAGQDISVGGIGEVCTLPEWRRKGLSSRLLEHTTTYMQQQGIALSSLHAGDPKVSAFYERKGWHYVPIFRKIARIGQTKLQETAPTSGYEFATLSTLDSALSKTLNTLYHQFCDSKKFSGWFVRTEEYWLSWVAAQVAQEDTRYVVAKSSSEVIIAALSIRHRGQLSEILL